MHKRGIIRYNSLRELYRLGIGFIHFCMQRKNNENIPISASVKLFHIYITVKYYRKIP